MNIRNKNFIVVDLGSGEYTLTQTGHEAYNLVLNPITQTYLGYCPSHDDIDTTQLGAPRRKDDVHDVMVIYVHKQQDSSDREIIAFTDSATVYSEPQLGTDLHRPVMSKGKPADATYTIESEHLYNLGLYPLKFVIHGKDYSPNLFRRQRFYKGSYPDLDKKIIKYLEDYLNHLNNFEDFEFQKEINDSDFPEKSHEDGANEAPVYTNSINGKQVAKKARISKAALQDAAFKCAAAPTHETFLTAKNKPYMEGHHLIPCTASNSEHFWETKHVNIDCIENIVCLCPTCHRKIHYGNSKAKKEILELLYNKQISKLKSIGLNISLKELLALYQ